MFGRPEVLVTPTAKQCCADRVPDATYEARDVAKCLLGVAMVDSLSMELGPWPHAAPETWKTYALSWRLLVDCTSDVGNISKAWLSFLACEGALVYRPSADGGEIPVAKGLVLAVTASGLLVAPLKRDRYCDLKLFEIATGEVQFVTITDHEGWMLAPLKAIPPSAYSQKKLPQARDKVPDGMAIAMATELIPMLQQAAKQSFRHTTCKHLPKLLAILKKANPPPHEADRRASMA